MVNPSARSDIIFNKDVFPVPFDPVIATLAPSGIIKLASSKIVRLPNFKLRPSAVIGNLLCSSRAEL